jgi:demethylmenaquinone methyltransferase/2-methoxy-6-polyprenyl-1,4-benzoquinol methylase
LSINHQSGTDGSGAELGAIEPPGEVRGMFERIAPRYDLANALLSGGMDFWWRWRAARVVRSWEPALLLDLATGSGVLAKTLSRACPRATIVGADFCEPLLRRAKDLRRVQRLVRADALRLPFTDGTFDAVTVAFGLRNMASWPGALREMRRVLKADGHLLVLDFSLPEGWWRGLYLFYLRHSLPKIAGAISGERSAYEYLAESISRFPRGDAMLELLEASGFDGASATTLSGGIVSLYQAAATPSR